MPDEVAADHSAEVIVDPTVISFGSLCLLVALGQGLRARSSLLRRLHVPTPVIAGALGLGLVQLALRAEHTAPLARSATLGWPRLPGLLINLVFAGIFLGDDLPSLRVVLREAGPQLCYGMFVVWGQWVVGTFLVATVLGPLWDSPPLFATVLPIGFAGGHGTAGGMAPAYAKAGFHDGLAFGLVTATVGLLGAVLLGVAAVNWALRSGVIARRQAPPPSGSSPARRPSGAEGEAALGGGAEVGGGGLDGLTLSLSALGAALLLGGGLKHALVSAEAWVPALRRARPLSVLPLFPLCMVGGILLQGLAERRGLRLGRQHITALSAVALELLVVAAMATIDAEGIHSAQVVPLALLNLAGIAWNLLCLFVFARFLTPDYWFERGIAELGSAMGVLATGILLLRMADPADDTPVMRAFNLKQLVQAMFMGGGLWTATGVVLTWKLGAWPVFWITLSVTLCWAGLCLQLRRAHIARGRKSDETGEVV
eukprot:TRINITY_DN37881_c0_g1_i1.p1 TRINITY_DN37881_c0_g1~~TRINITY_DN37881_c0_g1_i1.p1  ORF type:complete len:505 (+),score=92.49 TRINITY_DN37881_c0_g1_i1:66-1517(+)